MRLLALPVLFLAVGCGSDGTKKPQLLDGKVFLDAGVDAPPSCGVKADLGSLALGSDANPAGSMAAADWYEVFPATAGGLAGKNYLDIGANLPPAISGDAIQDVFIVDYVKPAAGYALNTAVPFNSDPAAATPVAFAYMFTDVQGTGANVTTNKFLWASAGSITLTATVETDGGLTKGTLTGGTFREVDEMTNADVPGGCTTKFGMISFVLKQTEIADTFTSNSLPNFSPELSARMHGMIKAHEASMGVESISQ